MSVFTKFNNKAGGRVITVDVIDVGSRVILLMRVRPTLKVARMTIGHVIDVVTKAILLISVPTVRISATNVGRWGIYRQDAGQRRWRRNRRR